MNPLTENREAVESICALVTLVRCNTWFTRALATFVTSHAGGVKRFTTTRLTTLFSGDSKVVAFTLVASTSYHIVFTWTLTCYHVARIVVGTTQVTVTFFRIFRIKQKRDNYKIK